MFKTDDVIVYMAGAGCGKTTALMKELEGALKIYRPDEVAFVSFSRKATSEVKSRAKDVAANFDEDLYPYFKTIHALTFMLNDYQSQGKKIIGTQEAQHFGQVTRFKFNMNNRVEGQRNSKNPLGQECFDWWSLQRSSGRKPTPKELPEQRSYREFVELYEKFKEVNNLIDYHDCLDDYLKLGKPISKIKFAIIDEAQDLTEQQWEVCFKLFEDAKSIRIAGDDWQSIYKYQGASPAKFIEIANAYKLVKLEKSYRLPVSVSKLANKISEKIIEKVEKKVKPVKDEEGRIEMFTSVAHFVEYIDMVARDSEWFILTRANYQIQDIAQVLKKKLILFSYSNGFVLPETELLKIKQYYRWAKDIDKPSDDIKFCKKHGIKGDKWPDWWNTNLVHIRWRNLIREYEKRYGFEKLYKLSYMGSNILLTTVFRVKGGEADNVGILTATTRKIEAARYEDNDNELRILYTAITRTKRNLFFIKTESDFDMYKRIKYLRDEVK